MIKSRRHPGIHEAAEERVLLVTKDKTTGAERCDWWPSVEEAEESNMVGLEVRDRIKIQKKQKRWQGLASVLCQILGKSGTQDYYLRKRPLEQKEFFETVEEKNPGKKIC